MAKLKVDIGVIGAGSGGLSIAAVASQMGANVALLERDKMGGDCLNSGCVPSKSLLAAARRAEIIRHAKDFGIQVDHFNVDYKKVQEHVHNVIATIAPHDSVERFSGLGVNVIEAPGHFIGPREVEAGDTTIQAKWWVVATGSKAIVPPIPGLEDTPFLTNETIFTVAKPPTKLIVIGGGPIGCEMAQAHRMLGIEVVILELFSILPKDDQDCTAVVRKRFQEQGIDIVEGIKIKNVEKTTNGIKVNIERNDMAETIEGSHLLVATGRRPNLDRLHLEAAGIEYTPRGIVVDQRLRSSNKHVFVAGDAAGSFQFTHAAGYHAGIIIRNMLFRLPAKVNYRALPWVTYTEPEIAHVGLNTMMADNQNIKYKTTTMAASEIDRFKLSAKPKV